VSHDPSEIINVAKSYYFGNRDAVFQESFVAFKKKITFEKMVYIKCIYSIH